MSPAKYIRKYIFKVAALAAVLPGGNEAKTT
jgi:hypothetical protein